MKLIIPINILGYELEDLDEQAKQKVLGNHIQFWLETREYRKKYKGNYERAIDKAEEMRTPWFVHEYILEYCEKELIREIKSNKYLFNEHGDMLPIQYYTKDNKVVKTVLVSGGVEQEIEIKRVKK